MGADARSSSSSDDGYKVVFTDDFEGAKGELPDKSKWIMIEGTKYPEPNSPDRYGTGEVQRNTSDPENVSLDGKGNLVITALRNDPVVTDTVERKGVEIQGWTSARVETKRADFKAPPGGVMAIDYRFQLPDRPGEQGKAYWPAIWSYPGSLRENRMSWPVGCEFDHVENVQSKLDELWNVIHCKRDITDEDKNWGGSFDEPTGIANKGKAQCQPDPCQKAMNVGRFEWDRSGQYPVVRWFINGKKTFEVSPTPEFIAKRKEELKDYPKLVALQDNLLSDWTTMNEHDGFNLVLQIAMGGAFPDSRNYGGGPFATTKPGGQLIVDYVKISVKEGDGKDAPLPTAPPADPTKAPTTAPTKDPEPTKAPEPTQPPAPAPDPGNKDVTILELEDGDKDGGVDTNKEDGASGGGYVTAGKGDSVSFKDVNIKSSADMLRLVYRQKSDKPAGGTVKVTVDGKVVADISVGADSPKEWKALPFDMKGLAGKQDVKVTFSGDDKFVDVDSLQIGEAGFMDKVKIKLGG
jgi:hypothetical protein